MPTRPHNLLVTVLRSGPARRATDRAAGETTSDAEHGAMDAVASDWKSRRIWSGPSWRNVRFVLR